MDKEDEKMSDDKMTFTFSGPLTWIKEEAVGGQTRKTKLNKNGDKSKTKTGDIETSDIY